MFGVIVEVIIFSFLAFICIGSFYKVFRNSIDSNHRVSLIVLVCVYLACAFVALSIGSFVSH